jgi:hypothetical protein
MSLLVEPDGPKNMRNRVRLESRLVADLLSLFLSLPLSATLVIIRYGPAPETPTPLLDGCVLPIAFALIALGAAAFHLVFASSRPALFVVSLCSTVVALVVASMLIGAFVHRDFFTAAFQYLIGALIAFMYRVATHLRHSLDQGLQRRLSRAGVVVSVFYVEWIMLMGYAITTRAEPRPIESIIYNVYNLAQVLILLLTSRWVERNTFHTVTVEGNTLDVDGRDLVSVLGQKKAKIFRGFALVSDRRLRCSEIQMLFREEADDTMVERCASCSEQTTKVALCARYRNTYNGQLELKRVLEFLEIGTITAPENKRRILTDGWRLALFENVRLVVRKK